MNEKSSDSKNPYMEMGFVKFTIISMLIVLPWYLPYRVIRYGLHDTWMLIKAMLYDHFITFVFILIFGVIVCLLVLGVGIFQLFSLVGYLFSLWA